MSEENIRSVRFYTNMKVSGYIPASCNYIGFYKKQDDGKYYVLHLQSGLAFVSVTDKDDAIYLCNTFEEKLGLEYLLSMGSVGDKSVFTKEQRDVIEAYIQKIKNIDESADCVQDIEFKFKA